MGQIQKNLLAPFAIVGRAMARKIGRLAKRTHDVKHYASYKEGKIGLAELVRHRGVMMETLYERRETLASGEEVVCARFRYEGAREFPGGNKKFIQPGDVIFAEFIIGGNKGEFLVAGVSKENLPRYVLLYWENLKNGPGSIILRGLS